MNKTIVIAGGGLAGAAAACALAQAGRKVTLIERQAGPVEKICGEFLSTEAQAYLAALGLNLAALGGHRISQLRLVHGAGAVATALPFQGIGLSRKILDEALLNHAEAAGAEVIRGQAIRRAEATTLQVDGLGQIAAETLFLATGKHDLRGLKRFFAPPPRPLEPDRLRLTGVGAFNESVNPVGFKMYFGLEPAQQAELARHVELIMFAGGYAGLQLVEQDKANLCLLVRRDRLAAWGATWPALLDALQTEVPHLARRLAAARPLLDAPLTISGVPYGYLHRPAPADDPRIYRLGDQAGVIPSFTGDGMSIALHSARLAVKCYLEGRTSDAYHAALRRHIGGQIRRAGGLSRLIERPTTRALLFNAARAWPAGLALAARLTRVPAAARLS